MFHPSAAAIDSYEHMVLEYVSQMKRAEQLAPLTQSIAEVLCLKGLVDKDGIAYRLTEQGALTLRFGNAMRRSA
jgi:hypothetical protein